MSENIAPKKLKLVKTDPEKLDFPFGDWVRMYHDGELTPEEFVSEMEFDGFDGDLIQYL
jgi:hypothetical protein